MVACGQNKSKLQRVALPREFIFWRPPRTTTNFVTPLHSRNIYYMSSADTKQQHPSPYKIGNWTVTRLREELKSRKAPITGSKDELVQRLERLDERAHQTGTPPRRTTLPPLNSMKVIELKEELKNRGLSPLGSREALISRLEAGLRSAKGSQKAVKSKSESSRSQSTSPAKVDRSSTKQATRARSSSTSPVKEQPGRTSPLRAQQRIQQPCMSPLKYLSNATLYFLETLLQYTQSISPRAIVSLLLGFAAAGVMLWFEGPHTHALVSIQSAALWYGRWVVLGAIATTTIGPTSMTFARYLVPFLSRVTNVAVGCGSTNFPVYGKKAFQCIDTNVPVDTMSIFLRIYYEVFAWTLGSIVGDLLYYILGYLGKPPRERRIDPKVRPFLLSYDPRIAYAGIVLLSLLPDLFSEILAMNAGYFNFPLHEFMWSVMAGRLVSAFSSALWTIFLFKPGHGEALIKWLHTTNKFTSLLARPMHHCILKTRALIASRSIPGQSYLGIAWQATIVLVTATMTLSAIRSAALKRHFKQVKQD